MGYQQPSRHFLVEGSTTKREENPASPVQDSEKSDEDIV